MFKFIKKLLNLDFKELVPKVMPKLLDYLKDADMKKSKTNDQLFSIKTKKSVNEGCALYNVKYDQYHAKHY